MNPKNRAGQSTCLFHCSIPLSSLPDILLTRSVNRGKSSRKGSLRRKNAKGIRSLSLGSSRCGFFVASFPAVAECSTLLRPKPQATGGTGENCEAIRCRAKRGLAEFESSIGFSCWLPSPAAPERSASSHGSKFGPLFHHCAFSPTFWS